MFKVMHYKLFYQDTMCVDLQTHLALSLCTGEMGQSKSRKKSEAEKFMGSKQNCWRAQGFCMGL